MSQRYYVRNEGTAGSVLTAAREELNLSVTDVARQLKLSPAQVEALEAGAYERLPGRVFVRGFLRNYAKLLGLDPQPLLRSVESHMPEPVPIQERPPSAQVVMPRERAARWPLYVALTAVIIVGALAVYEFGFNEPKPNQDEANGAVAVSPEAPPGAFPASAEGGAAGVPAPVGATPGSVVSTPAPSASAPAAQTDPARNDGTGALAATEQPVRTVRAGEHQLYFRFEQESWVEIRDRNDKVIFSKLNPAGSEERIAARPPLKLVVGNAHGVRLNYDDRPVDLAPHTGVTVARLTLE